MYSNSLKYENISIGGNPLNNLFVNHDKKLILVKDSDGSIFTIFHKDFPNDKNNIFSFLFNFIDLFKKGYKLIFDCCGSTQNKQAEFLVGILQQEKLFFIEAFRSRYTLDDDTIQIWTSTNPQTNIKLATHELEKNGNNLDLENFIKFEKKYNTLFYDKPYVVGNLQNKERDWEFSNKKIKYKLMAKFDDPWSSENIYSLMTGILTFFKKDEINCNFNTAQTLKYDASYKIKDLNLGRAPITNILNIYKTQDVSEYYKNTFINVISPQYVDENPLSIHSNYFIEESVFESIFNFQPFIYVGKRFMLRRLQELGFVTFFDYWDESYDNEFHKIDRTAGALSVLRRISKMGIDEINDMMYDMKHILLHNYNTAVDYQSEYRELYNDCTFLTPNFNDYNFIEPRHESNY